MENIHLAPGIDTTLLNAHFAVATDDVGALIFPAKSNKFTPTVNLDLSFSSFYGFNSHTILPYVTFFFLGLCFWNEYNFFFPFTVLIPWANLPSSFAN